MFAPPPPWAPVGRVVAAGTLALAALGGLLDVATRGAGLGAGGSLLAALVWVALALPAAALAGPAAALLARAGQRPAQVAAGVLAVEAVAVALAALALRRIALAEAAPVVGVALAAAALAPRQARGLVRAPATALGLAAACVLVAGALGLLRGGPSLPATAGGNAPAPAPAGAGPRHVVLVVLDTTRADHLGAYGAPGDPTPAFDALAAAGTLYEACFAPASWTVPAHASLFTGLPPRSHGASFLHHRWLDDRFTTLAEAFHAAGFRTLGLAANEHLELTNLHQGFEAWRTLGGAPRRLVVHTPLSWLGVPAWLADDGAASAAPTLARLLRKMVQPRDRAFVFVNLLEPHWRYLPPLGARLGVAGDPAGLLRATAFGARFYGPLAMAGAPLPPGGDPLLRALYAAEVRYQDAALARLLAVVDVELGLDQTLVLVTADHGENLGEAGRYDHVFAVNDHLVHVPLVARGPGFPAGRREEGLCTLQDVPATLGDVVEGVEIAPERGRSLRPGAFAPRDAVVIEGDPFYGHLERMSLAAGLRRDVARFTDVLRAVRGPRFKWVWSSREGGALYDLAADPDETRDVQAVHPARAAALKARLEGWLAGTPPYRREAGDAAGRGLDDAERARLEALGYVQ